jgi:PEP-CTERM motif
MTTSHTPHPHLRTGAGAVLLALLAAGPWPAAAETLTPFDSGQVTQVVHYLAPIGPPAAEALVHDPGSTAMYLENSIFCHYQKCEASDTVRTNAYALFQVPMVLGSIASVELRFDLQQFGTDNVTGLPMVLEWQVWDLGSPPADFQQAYTGSPTAPGLALLSDLASGIEYASSSSQGSGAVSLMLAGAAWEALAAARGGSFGIGFTVPYRYHNMRGTATASLSDLQLVITTVPEPGTTGMLLLGLGAVAAVGRQRASPGSSGPARNEPTAPPC